jgi:tRNA1Val (adenine37-N6)-methyltransferase
MSNSYFQFKEFIVRQDHCAMKVCTDSCLFGAWVVRNMNHPANILDIGSGTGLLALMLAQKSKAEIDAIEIEINCFRQLEQNLEESPWRQRLHPIHGDIRDYAFSRLYDLIICNPPFYANDLTSISPERTVAMHSSALTLDELFEACSQLLTETGNLYLIIPAHRTRDTEKISESFSFYINRKVVVKHSERHSPFRVFYEFSRNPVSRMQEGLIHIRYNTSYTDEFSDLLRDYYLHL